MSDAALRDDGQTLRGPSFIPEPRIHIVDAEATGANVLDWCDVFDRYTKRPKKYPLWNVSVGDRPFIVSVFREEGRWFAENDEFNVVGHGATIQEALADAYDGIKYLAKELLSERDESLSTNALHLKRKYEHVRID